MGLDITAYRSLRPLDGVKPDEDGQVEDYNTQWLPGPSMEWSEGAFPGRGEGIDAKTVYGFDDKFRFGAGSYGGYNRWRDHLARMAGYPSDRFVWDNLSEGSFYELINFADNDGVIGPVVSAKLARDFAEHAAEAEAYANKLDDEDEEGRWWLDQYRLWRKAFEMAADGGAVYFH